MGKATETRPEKNRRKRKRMRTVNMLNINCLAASREWHNSFVYSVFYTREVGPLRIVYYSVYVIVINEIWMRNSDRTTVRYEVLREKELLFRKKSTRLNGLGRWVPSRLVTISCTTTHARASFPFYTSHGHQ